MPVDPYAATNAFRSTLGTLSDLRQRDIDNNRNQLRDMYLGQQEQRAQAQDARIAQQDQIAQEERARELLTNVYAPLARQALESGNPSQFIANQLRNPAVYQMFKQDGIFDPDKIPLNDPSLAQSLEGIASFGEQARTPSRPALGNLQPGDYTPESLAAYEQSGNYADLRRYERPQAAPAALQRRVRTLSKEEAASKGLPSGGVYQEDLNTGEISTVAKPESSAGGLPVSALRIVDEAKQAIGSVGQSKQLVTDAIGLIDRGEVTLGMASNAISRGRNVIGESNAKSRAYASLKQTLEKLRNNYLLLAKGVQTEGDAQRAWNSEIGESVQNDNALAKQQLQKALGMMEQMEAMQRGRIDTVYSNFGVAAPDSGIGQTVTINGFKVTRKK